MLALIFPGQGSQKRGMGQGLFDEIPEYATIEKDVDGLLGYSMRDQCVSDPENRLNQTQYTQPCLYTVNALNYYRARSTKKSADFAAGHSVGEYTALLAAGAFDFLTGLRLVKRRGELMAKARNGGMAAVVGLGADTIMRLLRDNGFNTLEVANYNAPLQTVLSGQLNEIQSVRSVFEKAGARLYLPLPVSAAFHSRYMTEAATAFAEFLASFSFQPLKLPVISNVTARPYPMGDPTVTIRSFLAKQITAPVQWVDSIRFLLAEGVTAFEELGPGRVLTNLVKEIQRETTPASSLGTAAGR